MKLKFKNQAFQMDAVNAVVDLFAGQEKTRSTFSVMEEAQTNFLNELGQGNALYIDQETLTANMHTVQKRNNLPLTPTAEGCQFCIEMETGTGKTYVYTKTIFELNRKYGFTKFVLKNGTLDLPKKYEAARERFEQIIANADRKPPVRDASRDVVVRLNKQVMLSPEFLELWSKIKQKTAYRVSIDTEQLVKNCVKAFQEMPHIPKTRLVSQTADIHIQQSGISHMEREMRTMEIANDYQALPDIITAISDETLLTPATVNRILVESGRCGDFLNNPEAFLEQAVELIRSHRHALAIDGIRYVKLDGQEYYVQEIFDTTELLANLDRNAVKVEHSVYDYVVYDSSTVEKPVAVALDNDPDVKMFFKIPSRFKIETPIGTYNPDWAVYLNKNGEEKLYFVLETKGDTSFMHLKTSEQLKIHCGKEHFKALDAGVELETATSWTELRKRI